MPSSALHGPSHTLKGKPLQHGHGMQHVTIYTHATDINSNCHAEILVRSHAPGPCIHMPASGRVPSSAWMRAMCAALNSKSHS